MQPRLQRPPAATARRPRPDGATGAARAALSCRPTAAARLHPPPPHVRQVFAEHLVSLREALCTFGPFVLLAAVLLGAAYWLLDPTPPHRVVLATGPEQGAYAEFGKRYAALLTPTA